jgi:glycosyltransferase involved in cell wall biosynthesis
VGSSESSEAGEAWVPAVAVRAEAGGVLAARGGLVEQRPVLRGRDAPCAAEFAEVPTVSVVIPALNEAENLPHVLPRIPVEYEVILVDGASTDGTMEIARSARPEALIISQEGRGKGDALAVGFATAQGEILVTLDADGSALPEEIPRFIDALLAGADFAKGSRCLRGGGSADFSVTRRAGNRFFSLLVNVLFGSRYTDLCYGYNAFWKHCLADIDFRSRGFEVEALLHIRALKAGLRVIEVPSFEARRINGASKLKVVKDGFRVLRTILHERFAASDAAAPEEALAP